MMPVTDSGVAGVGVGVVGQGVAGGEAGVFVGGKPSRPVAVGPSLAPLIVIVTVAVSVPPLPSLIV